MNFILYFSGLIFATAVILFCSLIYIIPLCISILCEKCKCCKNNDSSSFDDKLSYSYFCTKNKIPLIITLIFYLAILIALLVLFILYLIKFFSNNKNETKNDEDINA